MLHNKYYNVMKEFLKGYSREIYGRELIGKVNSSAKNIALTLKELEDKGILKCSASGNRKHYSLNFSNPLLIEQIINFENLRKIEFLEKNKKLIDLLRSIEAEIVCVFGSFAKERNRKDSDLDLFIVGKVNTLEIKKLGKNYGINVQVFNVSFKNFSDYAKERKELFMEVLQNHVLFKGQYSFVREVLKWKS
jgi:predicted nucleotidyltransferase